MPIMYLQCIVASGADNPNKILQAELNLVAYQYQTKMGIAKRFCGAC
jgi:hypothetical protein